MSSTLNTIVEEILKENQFARNSDKELIHQVLNKLGANLSEDQIDIIFSVVFESITRSRRKFQEKGMYLADPEIAKERRHKSLRVQQIAPKASPSTLQKIIGQEHITFIGDL